LDPPRARLAQRRRRTGVLLSIGGPAVHAETAGGSHRLKLLLIAAVIAVLLAIPIVRAARRFAERAPGSRRLLIGGAIAVLGGVALATPRLDRIAPHMRESSAALIPILGAAFGLACAAVCAIAVIVGVILSRASDRDWPQG
jgi:hypothetical protein